MVGQVHGHMYPSDDPGEWRQPELLYHIRYSLFVIEGLAQLYQMTILYIINYFPACSTLQRTATDDRPYESRDF